MAENLLWLAQKRFPNRKMIVWAASFHVMRNPSEIEVPGSRISYKSTIPMGQHVHDALGDKVFTVGFTALKGKAGPWMRQPFEIETAPTGTLEDIFARANIENGWLSLNADDQAADGLAQKVYSRPLGYVWMKAFWGRHFDAMVFNRAMEPSRR